MAELFDDISRIVGSNISRRRTLKLIMGLLAGGSLGLLGASSIAAAPEGECFTAANCKGPFNGGAGKHIDYDLCCGDLAGGSWLKDSTGQCIPCPPRNSG